MIVPCAFIGHRWRSIVSEEGPSLYCSRCGAETSAGPDEASPLRPSRSPRPAFLTRDMCVHGGMLLGLRVVARLRGLLDHVEFGAWLKDRGLTEGQGLDGRDRVHDVVIDLAPHERLLYLEFGVYKGTSIKYWASRVSHSSARFYGFDSFQGLPNAWRLDAPRGRYNLGGVPPDVGDRRIVLVPGLFEETLPDFAVPDHDRMVVNVDCDVYSAARVVLVRLEPHLHPGTILLFDELNDPNNELRALEEFLDKTGLHLRVLARSRSWAHWAFEILGDTCDSAASNYQQATEIP